MRVSTVRSVLQIFALFGFLTPPLLTAQEETPPDSAERPANKNLPLEAARMVHLTTDEGSWVSLDVSPDGQTIVFDLLGDLYLLPIGGGDARRITEGLAFDQQARFSPDGTEVLFVSDRSGGENLWILELATGDTTQVSRGDNSTWMSPDWAPDGEYLVASKGEARLGVSKLWIGHRDGGTGQILTPEPDNLKTVGAAVSPDGRWIWFARRQGNWQYNANFPQYQLAVFDRETGETYGRSSRYGSAFRPTLSPDGRWLVYGTRHDEHTGLRIRELASGEERWLAYPVQRDDQESIADRDVLPGMAFTPDSRAVIASFGGKVWRVPVAGGEPEPIPFRVDEDIAVGPLVEFDYPIADSAEFTVREIRDPVLSPAGDRLAFTALDRLYVMDWPGGTPRRVTEDDQVEAYPTWSPDGRYVAYVTWTPGGGHLFRARADRRGDTDRLTRAPGTYQQPAWSPDGERIVMLRGPARAYQEATGPFAPGATDDVVWVAAGGGPVTVVAPAEGRSQPHFAGDTARIYLSHGRSGLVSIRWDGTDEKTHVVVRGPTRPGQERPDAPSQLLMAPTGSQAVARVYNDLYLVTVPMVGEAATISVSNPERAAFPARRLTDIGGQFPAWSADGRQVTWAMGNAFVQYDLDDARAFADSVEALEADSVSGGDEGNGEEEDEENARYEPVERRVVVRAVRDIPQGSVVLRGATVLTMRGEEAIQNADVLVTGNRIAAVGRQGSVEIPTTARVVNVAGMTIVPGFVDTHAHLRPAWGLHKTQAWAYVANLAYGVTTTRDPQTGTTDVLTYGDKVEAGAMLGPRIYSTGPGIFGDYVTDPLRDLDHARDVMRRYSEYYDTKTVKMYMAGNRQQRQWVIMAAREQSIMPTTEGGLMFGYNITMMLDGYPGQEHSFPVYPIYDDVVTVAAETKMAYTPTLLVSYGGPFAENYFFAEMNPHDDPKLQRFTPHADLDNRSRRRNAGWFLYEEHIFPEHAEAVRDLVAAGGRAGVGSHGQLQGLGYHWELWAMQSGGLPAYDALRVATILGAEAIGLDQDIGTVEQGKLADLVILAEDPLADIRNTNTIRYVMKNGRLYDGDTLDEIWPRERAFEGRDWMSDEPAVTTGIPSP